MEITNNPPCTASLTFLYHELRSYPSSYSYALDLERFEKQVDLFSRVRLTAAGDRLRPEISFDDGHLSNYENALPVLARHAIVAHFFITVGWTAQKPGYMHWEQVQALHQAGQRIGAHGWTHTLLTHCNASQLQHELGDARHTLEDKLGSAITSMSLPGGRYNRRVLAACEAAGYTEIFTSIPRAEAAPSGLLKGRLNVRAGMSLASIGQLLETRSRSLEKIRRTYLLKESAKAMLGDQLYARLWALVNRQEAGISVP